MNGSESLLLARVQQDMPWVVRVEHDDLNHVLRLYDADASGDSRRALCSWFMGIASPDRGLGSELRGPSA